MHNILKMVFSITVIFSCAQTKRIGLKQHHFNVLPQHIIWFQFPGLASEQLALLRFSLSSAERETNLERSACLGNMWNFNLFKIRPSAQESFLSQITGSKNIKGQCEDYKNTPIWEYFQGGGRISGAIESGVSDEDSLVFSQECLRQSKDFYNNLTLWRMDDKLKNVAMPFHFQALPKLEKGKIYYDKSCRGNNCESDLSGNVKAIWEQYFSDRRETFFIIRDFNYLKALKRKDIHGARKILERMESLYAYFSRFNKKNYNILLLVTGAETRRFEFPQKGREWAAFEKKGKKIIYRQSSLMSPVYAEGPRAENFCGIFPESELSKRLSD